MAATQALDALEPRNMISHCKSMISSGTGLPFEKILACQTLS
jgi:hypothetical protein